MDPRSWSRGRRWLFGILVVIVGVSIVGVLAGGENNDDVSASDRSPATERAIREYLEFSDAPYANVGLQASTDAVDVYTDIYPDGEGRDYAKRVCNGIKFSGVSDFERVQVFGQEGKRLAEC